MKIAGVVVLYKPNSNVMDNIKSYLKLLEQLYVIDNSPIPNTNKEIFVDQKITYISNNGNKGLANALNVGAKMALKAKNEWLLTMNQNSFFEKEGLLKMILFLEELKNNKIISEILGFKYDKLGVLSPLQETTIKQNDKPTGLEYPLAVTGPGHLINLNIYKKTNGFKDWLFIDTVDIEYCLNIRKKGYKVVQMNTVKLKHNLENIKKKTFLDKTIYVTDYNATRLYYTTRNRYYLYDMYNKDFLDYCADELKKNRNEVIKIILFESNKIKKIKAIYKGYRDYKKRIKGEVK